MVNCLLQNCSISGMNGSDPRHPFSSKVAKISSALRTSTVSPTRSLSARLKPGVLLLTLRTSLFRTRRILRQVRRVACAVFNGITLRARAQGGELRLSRISSRSAARSVFGFPEGECHRRGRASSDRLVREPGVVVTVRRHPQVLGWNSAHALGHV